MIFHIFKEEVSFYVNRSRQQVTRKVTGITNFGAFVELPEGQQGLFTLVKLQIIM